MQVRERAPRTAQQVELLHTATEILQQQGNVERAHVVAELAGALGRQVEPGPEPRLQDVIAHIERLAQRVQRIEAAVERLQRPR